MQQLLPDVSPLVNILQKAGQEKRDKAEREEAVNHAMFMDAPDNDSYMSLISTQLNNGLIDAEEAMMYEQLAAMPIEQRNKSIARDLISGGFQDLVLSPKTEQKIMQVDAGDRIEFYSPDGLTLINSIPKGLDSASEKNAANKSKLMFDQTIKLRDQVGKIDPSFTKTEDAYSRIMASAEQPSAAGDLALIFNYMKMLDPGSTVREGEFATAQNATGVNQRVVNQYNNLVNGQRLNNKQRTDFVDRSSKLFNSARKRYDKRIVGIERQAKQFGIPFDQIFTDRMNVIPYSPTVNSANQSPTQGNGSGEAKIQNPTPEQYESLKFGETYFFDGIEYTKRAK